jgi:hypothetical protein
MFGLNDAERLTPAAYRANLHELARRIRAGGSELVLLTPNAVEAGDHARPPERVAAYAEIVREVGRELGVPVGDVHQAFLAARAADPVAARRLHSDAIHPNLRGHVLIAETAAAALVGAPVTVGELPVLQPRLPHLVARLRAGEPVAVVAMTPFDGLIAAALRRHFPQADVRVTSWNPAGQTLAQLEEAAKATGWWKFRDHPDAPLPDLVVVAVPPDATAADAAAYYRSYTWVLNWSQDMGKPNRWDCLAVLPSVSRAGMSNDEHERESFARAAIADKDLPSVDRPANDTTPAAELFERELGELLDAPAR